jgi:hypothetical protein
MVAAACLLFASLPREAPGRPRMYKNSKEADHAYYVRNRDRLRKMREISPKRRKKELFDAAEGHVDPAADIGPIEALLDQGCNFELDVLPTVARTVPELPRPLKNWGAPWRRQREGRRGTRVGPRRSDTEPRPADAPASTFAPRLQARGKRGLPCLPSEPPGRPRIYKNAKEADHAFYRLPIRHLGWHRLVQQRVTPSVDTLVSRSAVPQASPTRNPEIYPAPALYTGPSSVY